MAVTPGSRGSGRGWSGAHPTAAYVVRPVGVATGSVRRRDRRKLGSSHGAKRWTAGLVLAVVWLAVGSYGAFSYVDEYAVYRGFGAPRDPPGVATGRLVVAPFFSPSLGRRDSYLVYEPPGYDAAVRAGRRLPVLYLLHGTRLQARSFMQIGALGTAVDRLRAERRIRPFLTVMPEGLNGTFRSDTEWADTRHGRYESYVLDVVRAVDARWPTIADRRARMLAGLSEGAYGALNVGLHHLAVFGSIESWSGYYAQTPTLSFAHASQALLRANSPAAYVPALRGALARRHLRAFLYGGRRDAYTRVQYPFARELRAAGATVRTAVYPGRHSWRLWRRETPHMLIVADRWLRFTPRPRPSARDRGAPRRLRGRTRRRPPSARTSTHP